MRMRATALSILALGLPLALTSTVSLADGAGDCTKADRSSWKATTAAEAKARQAGYDVRNTKITGTCYEVYGVKDQKLYELFYSPVDLKLVATIKK